MSKLLGLCASAQLCTPLQPKIALKKPSKISQGENVVQSDIRKTYNIVVSHIDFQLVEHVSNKRQHLLIFLKLSGEAQDMNRHKRHKPITAGAPRGAVLFSLPPPPTLRYWSFAFMASEKMPFIVGQVICAECVQLFSIAQVRSDSQQQERECSARIRETAISRKFGAYSLRSLKLQ